jgi:hypothetical protein
VNLSTLLRSANYAASNESTQYNTCEFPLVNEKSKKKSDQSANVRFSFEVTGWKIIYDLLSDKQTVSNAISSLLATASSKSTFVYGLDLQSHNHSGKQRNYIRKDILSAMKALVLDNEIKLELKVSVSKLWNKLAKRGNEQHLFILTTKTDDETLLLLVKEGILGYLAEAIVGVTDVDLKVLLIEDLKCFFKYGRIQAITVTEHQSFPPTRNDQTWHP